MVDKIRSLDRKFSMERFYSITGGSRQKYDQLKRSFYVKRNLEEELVSKVRDWRKEHPSMGSRVLYQSMSEAGIDIPIGISAFEKLLSKRGLTIQSRKRYLPRTSDGHGKNNHPNLANGLVLNNINQLICADITYFQIQLQWFYLFVLKDVYSQRLISLIPSQDMKAINAVKTLYDLEKIRGQKVLKGCIHHSDNGSQYESKQFLQKLCELQMKISRAATCDQNGSVEQMNHIIKNMYLYRMGISTFEELKKACCKVQLLMNEHRAVKQLNGLTVAKFEQRIGNLYSGHRPQKIMYDFSSH